MAKETSVKQKRIETIDILRGFFIFSIIVVHLARFPNGYDIFTGRGILWVTNSEGFFLMSGMLIGLVRGRKALSQPFKEVAKKLLKRGAMLYVWTIGLTLLFTFFALQSGLATIKPGVWEDPITWRILFDSATFQYVYSWADFLQYYSIYLFASIPVIYALRKGKWWLVVAISVFLWAIHGVNAFLTWQLFFFCGAVAGWYWDEILAFLKKTPKWLAMLHYPLALAVLALSVVSVEGSLVPKLSEVLNPHFVRAKMEIWRVLVFLLWFSAGYRLVSRYETQVKKWVGWMLIPFGQNSLYVYILHSFFIFFVSLWIPFTGNIFINFIVTTSVLLLLTLAVRKKFLFNIIPR